MTGSGFIMAHDGPEAKECYCEQSLELSVCCGLCPLYLFSRYFGRLYLPSLEVSWREFCGPLRTFLQKVTLDVRG